MQILIILNLLLTSGCFYILIIKPYLSMISIHLDRTFRNEKIYGLHITKWDKPRNISCNSGVVIFTFNWKNPNKLDDRNKK